MDPQVLGVQQWVNEVYEGTPGFIPAPETGRTGWSTMFSLTTALQIELGVSPPSQTFGPATAAAVDAIGPIDSSFPSYSKVVMIVQSALWCKGYAAGPRDGIYGPTLTAAVESVQDNIGVPTTGVVNTNVVQVIVDDGCLRQSREWHKPGSSGTTLDERNVSFTIMVQHHPHRWKILP